MKTDRRTVLLATAVSLFIAGNGVWLWQDWSAGHRGQASGEALLLLALLTAGLSMVQRRR